MIKRGIITSIEEDWITIRVPFDLRVIETQCREAQVFLPDGRTISPEQRRKAWALIGEIAAWGGYLTAQDKDTLNGHMKRKFLVERMDELTAKAIQQFSLGNVDMETASLYISFLVDFCMENDVPTRQPIIDLCDDVQRAVYSALLHKRCIVCGKPATIHHVDRVGMGRNREEICHIGMRALPLCWNDDGSGHHQEAHRIGDVALCDRYHLESVIIDEKIARRYKMSRVWKNEQL